MTSAYIFFSEHVLVAASHMPPAFLQSASVFAAVTSPAKAGPTKASARAKAIAEMSVFMMFSPTRRHQIQVKKNSLAGDYVPGTPHPNCGFNRPTVACGMENGHWHWGWLFIALGLIGLGVTIAMVVKMPGAASNSP
jgi:hypothetical protein